MDKTNRKKAILVVSLLILAVSISSFVMIKVFEGLTAPFGKNSDKKVVYIQYLGDVNQIWSVPLDESEPTMIYEAPVGISLLQASHSNDVSPDLVEKVKDKGMMDFDEFEIRISDLSLSSDRNLLAWQESYEWCPGNYCMGTSSIKIMRLDKLSIVSTIDTERLFSNLKWSPSANYLAFDEQQTSNSGTQYHKVWLWNNSDESFTTLTDGSNPSWAPSSSLISVISFDLNDNSQKLKIVDINNPEKQIDVIGANKIIKEFFGASWSPDGKRLIILGKQSENPDLSLYIVDTETFSDGYFLPSSSAGKYQAPLAWSSNGKWIATREISSENPFGLIIVDARNGETILNASKLLGKILSWQWSDDGKKYCVLALMISHLISQQLIF